MSRLGMGTKMLLSRCGNRWIKAGPAVAPMGTLVAATPLCPSVRYVSTTRSKKAQAMKEVAKETVVPLSKEKSPKAGTATKTRKASPKATAAAEQGAEGPKTTVKMRASKAKPTASTETEAKPSTTGKNTTASKTTKSSASKVVVPPVSSTSTDKTTEPVASGPLPPPQPKNGSASTRFAPPQKYPTPSPLEAAAAPGLNPAPPPTSRPVPPRTSGDAKAKLDDSPEYKAAAWRWTSTMIALPVLLVTSYVLFDRLVLGNHRSLESIREQIRGATSGEARSDDAA